MNTRSSAGASSGAACSDHVELAHRTVVALVGAALIVSFGIVEQSDAASEFGFHGTFREIQPPSRIVHTEVFDPGSVGGPHPESEAVVTTMFAEEGGITTLTTIIDFGSKEARDAALKTGMTDGMEQSYQLLDRLIETQ